MNKQPSLSVPIYFVDAVLKHIPRDSEQWHAVLASSRISPDIVINADSRARVSGEQFSRLQTNAIILLQDEALGYGKKPLPPGCWFMMCQACISADVLIEVAKRHFRFYNLFDWGVKLEIQIHDSTLRCQMTTDPGLEADPYLYEFVLFNAHRFFSWIVGKHVPISSVHMPFMKPAHSDNYRILFPGAEVHFNEELAGLVFNQQLFFSPVTQTTGSLRRFLRHSPYELIKTFSDAQSWAFKIQRLIGRNVASAPAFEDLADELKIHPQTLRRRLAEESTTYREIKNNIRRDIAIHFLGRQGLSIEDVAERVGFTETSSFIRAFKNWTGLTPHNYRKESALDVP